MLFSSYCYRQGIFERIHFTLTGIEDFASSRRRIDNLSVWPTFQRFHSFLFQRADLPGARTGGLPPIGGSPSRGARIFQKKRVYSEITSLNDASNSRVLLWVRASGVMYVYGGYGVQGYAHRPSKRMHQAHVVHGFLPIQFVVSIIHARNEPQILG